MESEIEAKIKEYSDKLSANPNDDKTLYERGKLYWKNGKRAESITDFNSAVAINPDSPAKEYLKMVNEILDFYNTDLYNP